MGAAAGSAVSSPGSSSPERSRHASPGDAVPSRGASAADVETQALVLRLQRLLPRLPEGSAAQASLLAALQTVEALQGSGR
jgi:hypothetical protein